MSGTATEPPNWPRWQWVGLIVLALPIVGFTVPSSLFAIAKLLGHFGGTETPGIILLRVVCALIIAGFGALLLARGSRNRAAALLGILLLAMSTHVAPMIPPQRSQTPLIAAIFFALVVRSFCIGYFWPLFCLEISGGPASLRQNRFVHAAALIFAVMPAIALWAGVFADRDDVSTAIWIVVIIGNQFLGYWVLASNFRRNEEAGRNRIKIAFFGFLFFLTSSIAATANVLTDAAFLPVVIALFDLAGAVVFAYAVLRRRLFDFSFALNRTLVFGAVSIILIAAFGLAKWGIEHLIPEKWHEGSAFYSAAIALALFMALHPVMSWVEHQVEKLFFHEWHVNEEALRRFVASAAHFEQSPALCRAFADELTRFAKGAAAALYLRQGEDGYVRQAGNLPDAPPAYPREDPGFALMRAERRPIEPAGTLSALPGALALPMLDQGRLIGFALLGRKEGGADYRPDEVALLGWAAHQIGLDLQAIHASELESALAEISARSDALSRDNERIGAERDRLDRLLAVALAKLSASGNLTGDVVHG